jgi:hypothetical protein
VCARFLAQRELAVRMLVALGWLCIDRLPFALMRGC